MTLEELEVYRLAMEIGERVYSEVVRWDFFAKDTIGKQLVRSVDSIAANISEGYGRFHFKENRHFNFYSRGSLFETKTWITKAANRNLITKENYLKFESDLNQLGRMLNGYIKSIGNSCVGVKEPNPHYGDKPFSNDQ
jgi:four helix bundle protein